MSYRHSHSHTPKKSRTRRHTLSTTRTAPSKFDKYNVNEKHQIFITKYNQLDNEITRITRILEKTKVRPPAFSDVKGILQSAKKNMDRNNYNKAFQQLTLAITTLLSLCSPAESRFNSARGALGPSLGLCANPEVLLKWHMIPKPKEVRSLKPLKLKTKSGRSLSKNVSGKKTKKRGKK